MSHKKACKSLAVVLLLILATCCFSQTASTRPEEKTIAVFGQTIHYWDVGSGPVLVLLHGLGSRKEDWGTVIGPLSQKYRLLVPDQVGFGQSDKPPMDYKIQTYVDFLNEFLRVLKIDRMNLAGESLGGWIAASYATEVSVAHLVPIDKLVLVDAAGLNQDKPVPYEELNPSSLEAMRALMKDVFYNTSWLTDERLRQLFAGKLSVRDGYTVHSILTNPNLASERLDKKLSEIRVPTLVLWGKQDTLVPVNSGERYAAGIPGAKLVTFDQCGHVPPGEKPAEFVAAVSEFLASRAVQ